MAVELKLAWWAQAILVAVVGAAVWGGKTAAPAATPPAAVTAGDAWMPAVGTWAAGR